MDYETILKSMLDSMPAELDTREGSILYTLSAPMAYELAKAYYVLKYVMNCMLPDTAEDEFLSRITTMFGITRQSATKAIRKLEVYDTDGNPMNVDPNSRFRIENISCSIIERISDGVYKVEIEQPGTVGNDYYGNILPLTNIDGLGSALLTDVLIMAQNDEDDQKLRERFYDHVSSTNFAGNVHDYKERTLEIDGVGAIDVFPVWNGAGTVLLVVGNELQREATEELVKAVQDYYQPADAPLTGMAPIGHTVTCRTSTSVPITVTADINVADGSSLALVEDDIKEAITKYIDSIGFTDSLIYVARLTATILDIKNVVDVSNVKINNEASNFEFSKTSALYQTPGELTITLTEV